jgi:hypothetical protein
METNIEWDQVPADYKSQLSNCKTIHDPSISNKNYNWHGAVDFNGIRCLLIKSFQVIWLITNFSYLSFCITHDQRVKIESILLSWILLISTAKRYNCQIFNHRIFWNKHLCLFNTSPTFNQIFLPPSLRCLLYFLLSGIHLTSLLRWTCRIHVLNGCQYGLHEHTYSITNFLTANRNLLKPGAVQAEPGSMYFISYICLFLLNM